MQAMEVGHTCEDCAFKKVSQNLTGLKAAVRTCCKVKMSSTKLRNRESKIRNVSRSCPISIL